MTDRPTCDLRGPGSPMVFHRGAYEQPIAARDWGSRWQTVVRKLCDEQRQQSAGRNEPESDSTTARIRARAI